MRLRKGIDNSGLKRRTLSATSESSCRRLKCMPAANNVYTCAQLGHFEEKVAKLQVWPTCKPFDYKTLRLQSGQRRYPQKVAKLEAGVPTRWLGSEGRGKSPSQRVGLARWVG